MPVVRTIQRQVQPGALPGARKSTISGVQLPTPQITAVPSAEAEGADVGEALSRVGQTVFSINRDAALQQFQKEKRRQDSARVLDADQQLNAFELPYLNDPKTGLFATHRGKDAAGIHEQASQDWQQQFSKIYDGLSNEEQRSAFTAQASTREQDFNEQIYRFQNQELQKFAGTSYEEGVQGSIDAGIANADDPVRIGTEAERIRMRTYNYGTDYGMGPDWIKNHTAAALSKLHTGVIGRMLTAGQDQVAAQYFKDHKSEIAGGDLEPVEKALQEGSSRGDAQRQSDAIWQKNPNATLSVLMDAAAAIKDPDVRDRTQGYLEARWRAKRQDDSDQAQARAADAKSQIDTAMQGMLNAIDRGMPRDMAGVHRLVDSVSPGLWAQLDDKQRGALETYAKKLQDDGKVETDQSHWYALMREASDDPGKFSGRDLMLSIGKLSDSDFQQLAKLQADVKAGRKKEADAQLDDFRTRESVLNDTLTLAGIDPKSTGETGKQIAKLRQRLDELTAEFSRNTGKKATNEDIQKMVDSMIIPGKPGSWWNIFSGGEEPVFDQPAQVRTEPTATNPATGEVLILRDGKWVKP